MKTLSWNGKGPGSPRAVRALVKLICIENPTLVFLMETKVKVDELLRIKRKLKFKYDMIVDCRDSGRDITWGLCLLWNEVDDIHILSHSSNHIGGAF